jgi:peptide/nickel transport system ATP-binding protein
MAEPNSNLLLQVRDLDVRFRIDRKHEPFRAVKGISFDIPANSTVALVGESGSGKSVSAMSILGLLPENAIVAPSSQAIYYANPGSGAGRDLLKADLAEMQALRGKDISVIFQEPMTSLNPVFTIGEQIAESLRLHMGMTGRQAQARVIELLAEVGIPNPQLRANSYPHEMSGGQQQRVMIAMAIACEPKLLIADEPTTALDVTIQKQILDLIASLQAKHHMSVLFITHDLGVVGDIADHVVVMQNGEIQEQGLVRQIFEAPQHPYTKALLACRPRLDRRPKRLPVIDDFMKGDGRPHLESARAARGPRTRSFLEVKGLNKTFFLKEGLFGKRAIPAVKEVSFRLPKGKTLGLVGRVGLGQDDRGPHAHAPARRHQRRGALRGHGPAEAHRARDDGLPPAHPDHLPESVRLAEPALHRRPDPGRADEDPLDRQGPGRARRDGLRSSSSAWACPSSRSTSTRTSSRVASARGSRSRAASP